MTSHPTINIGAPGAPFYTPIQDPAPGTAISPNPPPLFQPLTIRGVTFPNRVNVSSMCMYSSDDGLLTDWHLVHLGQFALRGAGLIMVEATAVTPEGRISPEDSGIWDDKHVAPLKRIVDLVHSQGVKIGIQLAHAGRKGSTPAPFITEKNRSARGVVPIESGGWPTKVVAPSAVAYNAKHAEPNELSIDQIQTITDAFVKATERAIVAGFDVVELHYAHGYLAHEFFSPIANKRTDKYGGSFENRIRFGLETAERVRAVWPEDKPLFVRVSATDWVQDEPSWDLEQTVKLARELKTRGVDLIDTSTGGNSPAQKIPVAPGFQVPFAERIKKETGILTGAVGSITNARQANKIIESGQADVVFIARAFLTNGGWVHDAAEELGVNVAWPAQYHRHLKRSDL
ncbi:hypothetical protein G9A89_002444 [Geosiphon pyriformis]|nr:hypothetical protein G9A89_002444 [Geosiphon pyriformis]